jgi:hypothetical protein
MNDPWIPPFRPSEILTFALVSTKNVNTIGRLMGLLGFPMEHSRILSIPLCSIGIAIVGDRITYGEMNSIMLTKPSKQYSPKASSLS